MTREPDDVGFEGTPTYAVAITVFVFILVSLVVERAIHRLKKYLKKKKQKPLLKVLDKMTEELMLLGFISLLLTVLQNPLTHICVGPNFSKHLLPCSASEEAAANAPSVSAVSNLGRRLLSSYLHLEPVDVGPKRQLMQTDTTTGYCGAKGKVPFVSLEVLHQLHIFIFVLAITHVCYSLATVMLGFARVNNWRKWEMETRTTGYDGNKELENMICHKLMCEREPLPRISGHAHAFVHNRHANHPCYQNSYSLWVMCFFQQFLVSVSKEDYLSFRVGFLSKHRLRDSFNFRDYVIRSMEVDFKRVIGISWWLWLCVVLFLLLNVNGWYTYFWAAFIPTVLVLVIGTKQQHIIATLALQAKRHAETVLDSREGLPLSKSAKMVGIDVAVAIAPDDKLFWFDSPQLLLRLIRFVIFQNSFEFAIFFWLVTTLGWNSCVMGNHTLLIVRVVVGVSTQLLASYSTLPIYALVTQMGTSLKDTVFTKGVREGLVGWREKAKRNREKRSGSDSTESPRTGGSREGDSSHEGSEQNSLELPTVPSPRGSFRGPDSEVARNCMLMYGKDRAMKKLNAAKVTPERDRPSGDASERRALTDVSELD